MNSSRIAISVVAIMLFGIVTPASQLDEPGAGGELFEKVQLEFAEAYNLGAIAELR
jgi:hypothetical protein